MISPARRVTLLLMALSIPVLAGCAISKNQGSPVHPVDSAVIDSLKAINARGGSIAIRAGDSELYAATYGVGYDLEKPVTLASLSKPVTAYIVLQLQDDGLLSVDDPISHYVPEISNLRNSKRIANKTLLEFMTHNTGLAPQQLTSITDWKEYLNQSLADDPVESHVYANENYILLTRVVINLLGSYEEAIRQYVNVEGITTFRIRPRAGFQPYAGVGELEASASDYLRFMERSAPLSRPQSDRFGIAWFHGQGGYAYHQGVLIGPAKSEYAMAVWGAKAASGATVSFVFQADGLDTNAMLTERILQLF